MCAGLPVTRPARIAADLIADGEAPEVVALFVAGVLGEGKGSERDVAATIASHAVSRIR
jgi:hypothetical protein